MPCGLIISEDVDFSVPGSTGRQTVETGKNDRALALKKAQSFQLGHFQSDFLIKFNDVGASEPSNKLFCDDGCPNRFYLMAVSYDSLDVKETGEDAPAFIWDVSAHGKYRLAIYCLSDDEHLGFADASSYTEGPFSELRYSSVSEPIVSGSDKFQARSLALRRAYQDMFYFATQTDCGGKTGMRVLIYQMPGYTEAIDFAPDTGQEMITVTYNWRARIDCVPAGAVYQILGKK